MLAALALLAPWMFGAWEMWWFWGFTTLICISAALTGIKLIFDRSEDHILPAATGTLLFSMIPFLLYAAIRWSSADVFMSAERSVLLYLTGFVLVIEIIVGITAKQRHILFRMIFANLLAIGLYGILNQLIWKTSHVMWELPYPQYAGRAMGSYYCPDHFSGIMEILLGMSLAGILTRGISMQTKFAALAGIVVSLSGIFMSHSRGGLLTLPVIFGGAFIWCLSQWQREIRNNMRIIAVASALLALLALAQLSGKTLQRFMSYGGHWGRHWRTQATATDQTNQYGLVSATLEGLRRTSRGKMYAGAWRAWQTSPWIGIGAGMHQNLWPHFAASPDGDRESGDWPTLPNDTFHSYEVHSDWLQLLEEYGVVGFIMVLALLWMVTRILLKNLSREGHAMCHSDPDDDLDGTRFEYNAAALLALLAMAFHSLGDFNLQMPATVWILSSLLAIALSEN